MASDGINTCGILHGGVHVHMPVVAGSLQVEKARMGGEVSLFPGLAHSSIGSTEFCTNVILLSDERARPGNEARVK